MRGKGKKKKKTKNGSRRLLLGERGVRRFRPGRGESVDNFLARCGRTVQNAMSAGQMRASIMYLMDGEFERAANNADDPRYVSGEHIVTDEIGRLLIACMERQGVHWAVETHPDEPDTAWIVARMSPEDAMIRQNTRGGFLHQLWVNVCVPKCVDGSRIAQWQRSIKLATDLGARACALMLLWRKGDYELYERDEHDPEDAFSTDNVRDYFTLQVIPCSMTLDRKRFGKLLGWCSRERLRWGMCMERLNPAEETPALVSNWAYFCVFPLIPAAKRDGL